MVTFLTSCSFYFASCHSPIIFLRSCLQDLSPLSHHYSLFFLLLNDIGEGCATWGVSSLLLFVNANTLSSFSPRDRDSLLRGEAIIDEDHLTGNVVIRVLPKSRDDDESSECSDRGSSSYDKNDQSANAYNSVTHASKSNIETDQQTGTSTISCQYVIITTTTVSHDLYGVLCRSLHPAFASVTTTYSYYLLFSTPHWSLFQR